MKKLLSILTVFTLALTLSSCSSDDKESTDTPNDGNSTEVKPAEKFEIALITDTLGSEQFLLQAYNAFLEIADEKGFEAKSLEAADDNQWSEKARSAAVNGYDLIIGIGWKAADVFKSLADEFPETKFAVVDTVVDSDKVESYSFNTSDGAYVLGTMVAYAFPNETKFGYIGNYEVQSNYDYLYGYQQGILSVIEDAEFVVNYANTYSDTAAVYDLAKQQAASGAKFIMGSVSSSANQGLYQAALELADSKTPIYTTGLSVDQTTSENPYIIGGLTKNTAIPTVDIITNFIEGKFSGGEHVLGFSEGAFGVVHINTGDVNFVNKDIITDEVLSKTNEVAAKIKSNEIEVVVPKLQ